MTYEIDVAHLGNVDAVHHKPGPAHRAATSQPDRQVLGECLYE